jgi:hypothetical protein
MGSEFVALVAASGAVAALAAVAAATWLLDRLTRPPSHLRFGPGMVDAWRNALEEAAVHPPAHGRPATLRGKLHGFSVMLSQLPSEETARLDIDGGRRIPPGLQIGERQAALESGVPTGDAEFDSRVWVEGDEAVVAGLLDDTARSLIREKLSRRATLRDGHLILTCPVGRADRLVGEIESGVALARRLVLPSDLPARLATIAGADPIPAVRLRALQVLVARWPGSHATRAARDAAIRDPDEEIRLVTAIELGAAGEGALADLAWSPQTSEQRAVRALRALASRVPAERIVALADDALRRGRRALASEAIGALGRAGGRLAVSRLCALAQGADFGAAVESVRALGTTADASAERALVALLGSGSLDMRVAAVVALGQVGTAAAVSPLRGLVDVHPLDVGLRKTAVASIALIQQRLTGAAPGQLSLASAEGGRLTLLTDAPAGSPSLADPEDPPA